MAIMNPTTGITSQFGRAMKKFLPPPPLPSPVSRSFLFELIDTQTNMVEQSFSLVIPPNAVSIREPQRVTTTKTFGNVFVDDYGPDNIQIMIRGFSGTSHAWPTFQPANPDTRLQSADMLSVEASATTGMASSGYTHKSAFYTFLDTIIRYKNNYPDTFGDFKLRVYDLYDEQSYDCVLMDFSVDRTADRPLYYPYSITLLAYNMPDTQGPMMPTYIEMGGIIDTILEGINLAIDWVDGGFAFVSAIKSAMATITNTVNLVAARLATFTSDVMALAASPLDLTKQLIEQVGAFDVTVEAAYSNYLITKESYANAKEMTQSLWRQTLKLYHEAISQGAQSSRTERMPFDLGLVIPSGADLHSVAADKEMGVNEASRDYQIDSQMFTGVNLYTVRAKDTLQSIALNQMGDSALWPYLASVNDILDNVELHTHEQIYIPVKSHAVTINKDNFIVTENPLRDPYGTDIMIDSNGNFVLTESNDLALISGIYNIQQWVNMLFKTPIGSVIKQTTFGLSAQPGMPGDNSALRYLRMSCRSAIMLDPRIQRILSLNFTMSSDVIIIGMDLEIVGYDQTLPIEVTL